MQCGPGVFVRGSLDVVSLDVGGGFEVDGKYGWSGTRDTIDVLLLIDSALALFPILDIIHVNT